MNTNRILAGTVLESIRVTTPGNHVPHRYDPRPAFVGIGAAIALGLLLLAAAGAFGA